MSWISLSDEVAAIRFLLDHSDLSGPVNLTAPDPVTDSAFTATLDHALHRPICPGCGSPPGYCALRWAKASASC